jgi:hypothetical protein
MEKGDILFGGIYKKCDCNQVERNKNEKNIME